MSGIILLTLALNGQREELPLVSHTHLVMPQVTARSMDMGYTTLETCFSQPHQVESIYPVLTPRHNGGQYYSPEEFFETYRKIGD